MITTYDLGDPAVQQALADELCALGFDAAVCARPDSVASLRVTHAIEEAGRLDGLVYAAAPPADIVTTDLVRRARPAEADPTDEALPPHRTDIA